MEERAEAQVVLIVGGSSPCLTTDVRSLGFELNAEPRGFSKNPVYLAPLWKLLFTLLH